MRILFLLAVAGCASRPTPGNDAPRSISSAPIATTGPIARKLLATPGFRWRSFAFPQVRLHLSDDIAIDRVQQLADSAERARHAALALLGEPENAGDPPLELILVETRDDMRRLAGRPVAGSGFPEELSVVM